MSSGEKQITEVNDRKGKPWKFYSPWKTDVPEGEGTDIVTLEPHWGWILNSPAPILGWLYAVIGSWLWETSIAGDIFSSPSMIVF